MGVEGQLEAQICAAFNRHVMEDTTLWKDPGSFYTQSPANYYSRFWHLHGVNGKAYGFAYDDVSDQSSTLIETQVSLRTAATASFSNDSRSMTWHQWHVE